MVTEIERGIYTFEIVLPENPLKWLNCYVVKSGVGRNLLIDSGFRRPECQEVLLQGIKELELTPQNTDVLFTHLHADHTGNADILEKMGFHLMMNGEDYRRLNSDWITWMKQQAKRLGFPEDELKKMMSNNPARLYAALPFHAQLLKGNEVLEYGGRRLECVLTPGHTPGHLCLYDRDDKLMFTGDHVLFDISPNIVSWLGREDSLGDYLNSLEMLKGYEIRTALPAHRNCSDKSCHQRVDELLEHHRRRLEETRTATERMPGSTAYDIAAYVKWKIRARNWEEFPPGQKWFAVGECMAHLEYLEQCGRLQRQTDSSGIFHFYPTQPEEG